MAEIEDYCVDCGNCEGTDLVRDEGSCRYCEWAREALEGGA